MDETLPTQTQDIRSLLEKRTGFKQGVTQLTKAVCDVQLGATCEAQLSSLFPLVARVHQLLKARHTNLDFWRTGATLFSTCQHLKFPSDQLAKIHQFHGDTQAYIKETTGDGDAPSGTGTGPGLGAGFGIQGSGGSQGSAESGGMTLTEADVLELLSGPPPQPESHYDDAGPIVFEDSERWRRAQVSGTPVPASTSEGGPEGGASTAGEGQGDAAAETRARSRSVQQQRRDLQRQILEGIQAVYSGVEAVSRGTEAVERELGSILEALGNRAIQASAAAAGQQQARPPASRKVLSQLPVVEATEEKLLEWGQGCACAVCMCELAVGEQVQVLPCHHMYHPSCVAPWLAKDNTCPMCRKELPTDDPHYEARKEREAELEAERRGAANALRGGEHMYI